MLALRRVEPENDSVTTRGVGGVGGSGEGSFTETYIDGRFVNTVEKLCQTEISGVRRVARSLVYVMWVVWEMQTTQQWILHLLYKCIVCVIHNTCMLHVHIDIGI